VAVAGNSGTGKSSFINAVRGLRPRDAGAAKVGVSETTLQPTVYEFPNFPQARLWDLPGAGTALFPREGYIDTIGLRHFDVVIVVSSNRFTETEIAISGELRRLRIPFFMVRTKVDIDVANCLDDLGTSPEETITAIREDMQRQGVERPYMVSSRNRDKYDLPQLLQDGFMATLRRRGLDIEEIQGPHVGELQQPAAAG